MKKNYYEIIEVNCTDINNEEYRDVVDTEYDRIMKHYDNLNEKSKADVEMLFDLYCMKQAEYTNKIEETRTKYKNNLRVQHKKVIGIAHEYLFLYYILKKIDVIIMYKESDVCVSREATLVKHTIEYKRLAAYYCEISKPIVKNRLVSLKRRIDKIQRDLSLDQAGWVFNDGVVYIQNLTNNIAIQFEKYPELHVIELLVSRDFIHQNNGFYCRKLSYDAIRAAKNIAKPCKKQPVTVNCFGGMEIN